MKEGRDIQSGAYKIIDINYLTVAQNNGWKQ